MTLGTLEDALYMARQGVKILPVSVTEDPLTPGKFRKTPLTKHGHLDASCDEACIRAWAAYNPGAWGAVAEKFVAMDLDGKDAFDEALKRDFPSTPILKTLRTEGRHAYFQPFPGAWSGSGVLPGIDIRGGGDGWVVLYGRWNLTEMAEAPDWFKNGRKTASADPVNRPAFPTDTAGKIPHGMHHDWIISVSASLASRTSGVDEASLLKIVMAVLSNTLDDISDHEAEIATAVRSAIAKYGRPAPPRSTASPGGPSPPPSQPPIGPAPPPPSQPPIGPPSPDYSALWITSKKGLTPVIEAHVAAIEKEYHFVATREEHPDFLVYESGIYNGHAHAVVREWFEKRARAVGKVSSTPFVEQGASAIIRGHGKDRETFNPQGMFATRSGSYLNLSNLSSPILSNADPTVILTRRLGVDYVPGAVCPTFQAKLAELVPDPDTRSLIQEEMGYAFFPTNSLKKAFFWVGEKNTGKSFLLEVLEGVVGKKNVTSVSLHQLTSNVFSSSNLYGKMLNVYADLSAKIVEDTGLFKMLLGRDIIPAQKKYKDQFEFVNQAKLFYSANEMPAVPADDAFFDRWILTEFSHVVPDAERVPNLAEHLVSEEGPGILNWMLDGAAALSLRGRFAHVATAEQTALMWQRLSNSLVWFAQDMTIPGGMITKSLFYAEYRKFCDENSVPARRQIEVSRELANIIPGARADNRKINGKSERVWIGFHLKGTPVGQENVDAFRNQLEGPFGPVSGSPPPPNDGPKPGPDPQDQSVVPTGKSVVLGQPEGSETDRTAKTTPLFREKYHTSEASTTKREEESDPNLRGKTTGTAKTTHPLYASKESEKSYGKQLPDNIGSVVFAVPVVPGSGTVANRSTEALSNRSTETDTKTGPVKKWGPGFVEARMRVQKMLSEISGPEYLVAERIIREELGKYYDPEFISDLEKYCLSPDGMAIRREFKHAVWCWEVPAKWRKP